jgi:DNA-binding XRE family transcriptional regulator
LRHISVCLLSLNDLRCAYNHAVDWLVLRERLRTARERAAVQRNGKLVVGLTLDEAAKQSGLNRATIHSIENVKREPDLKPGLETIEQLGRAYGLRSRRSSNDSSVRRTATCREMSSRVELRVPQKERV